MHHLHFSLISPIKIFQSLSHESDLTLHGDAAEETRTPWLAPQLEKTHETPPSSGDVGLLFLHVLESNPESSLQTPQAA